MSESNLTLTIDAFYISPWSYAAWVTLTEKGLPFETRTLSFPDKEQLDPRFRQQSITGRVPMLQHGDFAVTESSAIVEYLDDAFPGTARALPTTPQQRARCRQVMHWIRSDMAPLRQERPTHTIYYGPPTNAPLSPAAREAADKLIAATSALVGKNDRLFESGWTTADADLALMLQRLIVNGDAVPPAARAFADAQWRRPSVRAWVDRERLPYRPY